MYVHANVLMYGLQHVQHIAAQHSAAQRHDQNEF